MATSGTATYNPSLLEIFQEAHDRALVPFRSGYDYTSAVRSFNLLAVEMANRGLTMYLFEQGTLLLVQGTTSYALPADTIDILDGSIRLNSGNATTQTDINISRASFSDYQDIPNKLTQGQPTQYSILRGTATPTIYFYLTPDGTQTYYFYYLRLRRMQDAGTTATNTADCNFRFYDAVIAGLAYRIASKNRESIVLAPQLKAEYEAALELAQSEDRDRSSIMLLPGVGRVA